MHKTVIALPVLALALLPFIAVALFGGITAPAIAQDTAVLDCAGPAPVGGPWRPPFTQAYAVGLGGIYLIWLLAREWRKGF